MFRSNVLFRKYDVKGPADRTLLYLTLYINACLKSKSESFQHTRRQTDRQAGEVNPFHQARKQHKAKCSVLWQEAEPTHPTQVKLKLTTPSLFFFSFPFFLSSPLPSPTETDTDRDGGSQDEEPCSQGAFRSRRRVLQDSRRRRLRAGRLPLRPRDPRGGGPLPRVHQAVQGGGQQQNPRLCLQRRGGTGQVLVRLCKENVHEQKPILS